MKLLSKITSGIVTKFKFITNDNYIVENVYVDRPEKNIICLSSLIGCSVRCKFCMSEHFVRSLTVDELTEEFNIIKSNIKNNKIILTSFMGVGDLTLNAYSTEILRTFNKISNKIAFSTVVPSITSFGFLMLNVQNFHNLKVQLSVHSINSKERKYLFGHDVPLHNITLAVDFLKSINFNNFELNYMLVDKINDSEEHCKLLFEMFGKYYIKFNRYNKTIDEFSPSTNEQTFLNKFLSYGGKAELYQTDGHNIQACCGQLTSSL